MIGALTNHVWQSTLFAAAAGLMSLELRKNRAKFRFWLWFRASIKFLIPFSLLIGLGSHVHWAPARGTAVEIAAPAASFIVEQIAEPFAATLPQPRPTGSTRD